MLGSENRHESAADPERLLKEEKGWLVATPSPDERLLRPPEGMPPEESSS